MYHKIPFFYLISQICSSERRTGSDVNPVLNNQTLKKLKKSRFPTIGSSLIQVSTFLIIFKLNKQTWMNCISATRTHVWISRLRRWWRPLGCAKAVLADCKAYATEAAHPRQKSPRDMGQKTGGRSSPEGRCETASLQYYIVVPRRGPHTHKLAWRTDRQTCGGGGAAWRGTWCRCPLRCTLGQNNKKHSIALLSPFVSKQGPNRGIKCQFDVLEKIPKGGPFYVENFFISDFTQVSCANFLGHKDSKHEIWAKLETKNVLT